MRKLVRNVIGRRVYDWPKKPENIGFKAEKAYRPNEYLDLLRAKLIEEAEEVAAAKPENGRYVDTLIELGDVYEVMRTLAHELGYNMDDIRLAADYKRLTLGNFSDKWVLTDV